MTVAEIMSTKWFRYCWYVCVIPQRPVHKLILYDGSIYNYIFFSSSNSVWGNWMAL